MKKIVLLASFVGVSIFANAQGPAKGRIFLAGTVGFGSQSQSAGGTSTSSSNFTVAPGAGYFLSDKVALGAQFSLKSSTSGSPSVTQTSTGFGVFGRYYITKDVMGAKASLFLDGSLSYQSNNNGGGSAKPTNTIGLGVAPGFALFPTDKWGFELSMPNLLGFSSSSTAAQPGGSSTTDSGFGLGLSTISGPVITAVYFIK
jgi:outer membrane protein